MMYFFCQERCSHLTSAGTRAWPPDIKVCPMDVFNKAMTLWELRLQTWPSPAITTAQACGCGGPRRPSPSQPPRRFMVMLTVIIKGHLRCPGHCARRSPGPISSEPPIITFLSGYYRCPHFTDEETEAQGQGMTSLLSQNEEGVKLGFTSRRTRAVQKVSSCAIRKIQALLVHVSQTALVCV